MRLVLLSVLLAAVGCRSSIDPDKARFTCANESDCGAGFKCVSQFAGGGLCYRTSECNDAEVCDGTDNDCDGAIDESYERQDMACTSLFFGRCSAGAMSCIAGNETCVSTLMPTAELCNGIDDDCDGKVDEDFDKRTDNANCGTCNHACGSGTTCSAIADAGTCQETNCSDGVDNDGNGDTDCADLRCFALECTSSVQPASHCGVRVGTPPDAGADAGVSDGGSADAGVNDGGSVDAGLPDAGPSDAGAVDAGPVRGCFAPETSCADAYDDDGDGLTDCADPDCEGRTCSTGASCAQRLCPGAG